MEHANFMFWFVLTFVSSFSGCICHAVEESSWAPPWLEAIAGFLGEVVFTWMAIIGVIMTLANL